MTAPLEERTRYELSCWVPGFALGEVSCRNHNVTLLRQGESSHRRQRGRHRSSSFRKGSPPYCTRHRQLFAGLVAWSQLRPHYESRTLAAALEDVIQSVNLVIEMPRNLFSRPDDPGSMLITHDPRQVQEEHENQRHKPATSPRAFSLLKSYSLPVSGSALSTTARLKIRIVALSGSERGGQTHTKEDFPC